MRHMRTAVGLFALLTGTASVQAATDANMAASGLPGSGYDQLLTDPKVGTFVVDPTTIGLLSKEGTKVIVWWEKYLMELRDVYGRMTQVQDAFNMQGQASREVDEYRQAVNICWQYAPKLEHKLADGGAGGFYVLYVNRIRDHVSDGNFRWCADRLRDIRQKIAGWEKDTKPFRDQRIAQGVQAPASGDKPRSSAWEPFSVFLANKDLLVGQLSTLKIIPSCELKGWGRDCEKKLGDVSQLKRIGPAFEQFGQAKSYFCENLIKDSIRVVPLTGGRDRQAKVKFSDGPGPNEYLNIQNAPSCT